IPHQGKPNSDEESTIPHQGKPHPNEELAFPHRGKPTPNLLAIGFLHTDFFLQSVQSRVSTNQCEFWIDDVVMDARIPDVRHLIQRFKHAIFVFEAGTDERYKIRELG